MQQSHDSCFRPIVLHTLKDISQEKGGVPLAVLGLLQSIADQNDTISLKLLASQGKQSLIDSTQTLSKFEWQILPDNTQDLLKYWHHQAKQEATLKQSCLIHDHGIWLLCNHLVAKTARSWKTPRIVSVHGMLEPWAWRHNAWKKRVAWILFQRYDLMTAQVLHATSEAEAVHIKRLCPHVPVAVIPLGVKVPPFVSLQNLPKQRIALFLSRLHPKKGLTNLIKAWHQLQPKGWKLVIVGPDENGYRALVEKQVKHLRLESSVQFRDAVHGDAKWHLYREASLFVLPTLSENFGMVVAEALACGTPVITTKAAPWADLLTYQCGWWIDTGVPPLVEALQQAMSLSQEELSIIGYRGQKLFESKYTWSQVAEQTLILYQWILGNGQKPPYVID